MMRKDELKEKMDEILLGVDRSAPFKVDGVEIGTPFNLKQVVDKYSKTVIPKELGIYHLFYHMLN